MTNPESPKIEQDPQQPNNNQARERVNKIISRIWSEDGVDAWWNRPRLQLDDQSPEEVWPEQQEAVLGLAIDGLEQADE